MNWAIGELNQHTEENYCILCAKEDTYCYLLLAYMLENDQYILKLF